MLKVITKCLLCNEVFMQNMVVDGDKIQTLSEFKKTMRENEEFACVFRFHKCDNHKIGITKICGAMIVDDENK